VIWSKASPLCTTTPFCLVSPNRESRSNGPNDEPCTRAGTITATGREQDPKHTQEIP